MADQERHPSPWELADLATPMAVRVAATYSIADHIGTGHTTAEAIARAAGLHAGALDRVLRHLVTLGLLRHREDGYELTERGAELRSDHPGRQQSLIRLDGAIGRGDLCFVELAHAVRTGEPAFPVRYGTSFWEDLDADESLRASFDAIMGGNVTRDAELIATAHDWSKLTHLMDVGGGDGSLLTAILREHPTLRGTVFDLPTVVRQASRSLQTAGLTDRADVMAGSFFDPLPTGPDGYLLSSVLHDWDDEVAVAILRRCADALGPAGRVFVVEETGWDNGSPGTGMDLRMLAYFAGQERDLAGNIALGRAAGLTVVAVHPAAHRSVIEFRADTD